MQRTSSEASQAEEKKKSSDLRVKPESASADCLVSGGKKAFFAPPVFFFCLEVKSTARENISKGDPSGVIVNDLKEASMSSRCACIVAFKESLSSTIWFEICWSSPFRMKAEDWPSGVGSSKACWAMSLMTRVNPLNLVSSWISEMVVFSFWISWRSHCGSRCSSDITAIDSSLSRLRERGRDAMARKLQDPKNR